MISIVVATNNQKVLAKNILKSMISRKAELILQQGYTNIGKAYNAANPKGDIVIYAHQDVYMPPEFEDDLNRALEKLKDEQWGVLGVAGVKYENGVKYNVGHVLDRGREWGKKEGLPAECDTLDELMLIVKGRQAIGLFDEQIPTCHFYGADICLLAKEVGLKVMAIDAFCHHNSTNSNMDESFWKAADYMKAKWKTRLPFATTCAIIQ